MAYRAETIGITLDEHGWANVAELIDGISKKPASNSLCLHLQEDTDRTYLPRRLHMRYRFAAEAFVNACAWTDKE